MSNSFYTHGAFPSTGSAATSASMRAELDLISAGFDKMPTLSGNANLFVVINSTGTGLTQTSTLPSATFTDTLFTIQDDGDNTRKFQFNASTVTPGATRIYSVPDANTTLVGTDTTQTLTNKTLTAPVISSIVNTGSLSLPTSTDTLVGRATTDTLTNKTLTSPVIATIVNTGTLTLPTSTDTLVGRATTDTLTNKTLTSPVIATIVNTGTLTLPTSTDTLVGRATTDTLTNKTLTSPVIATIVNTGTLTLPTSTDTLVGRATTDTLTNKTLTSPVIATIVNTGTLTLPTSTDTLVGRATTDTLTNKTLGAFTISGTVSGGGNQINNVIIGTTTPLAGAFTTLSTTGLASLPSTGRSAAAALTVTNPAFLYGVASTYTDTASSGVIAAMAPFYSISGPTLSTSNVTTYTNAATLYIANAPTAGGSATITNPYAVYVAAGAAYFGGAVTFAGSASLAALTVTSLTNTGLTLGRVPYSTTAGLQTDSANLTFNGTTLTANTIGAFTLSGTVAGGGNQINNVIIGTSTPLAGAFTTLSASTSITNTGLTSGRVVFSTTGGLETDSANLLYSGTDLTVYGLTVGRGAGAVSTNTAVGASALVTNSTGAQNTALGYNALNLNTTTNNSTAVGFNALAVSVAYGNTGVGARALQAVTSGTENTAIGATPLVALTTGNNNVAVGSSSLVAATTGSDNVAVGRASLFSNTTGGTNVAVGTDALRLNTTASNNTAVGHQAGYTNATGARNVFVGTQAGQLSTASQNTFVGVYAGNQSTGSDNTAVGYNALQTQTVGSTGSNNTAVGTDSLQANTTGAYSVALGKRALFANTTGQENTAVGYGALEANTTGQYNVAQGLYALRFNTTASNNTAVGYQAGYSNTTGAYFCTFIGQTAGYLTTGSGNTFIGTSNTTGQGAGYYVTSGSKNTILGGYNGNQGGLDIRTASNYIVLSDGDGNPRGIFDASGNLGIGTSSPAAKLDVVSTAGTYAGGIRVNGTTTGNTLSGMYVVGCQGTAHYNWLVGSQFNINNGFEITPSTVVNGTTFSTPSLIIDSSGNFLVGTTTSGGAGGVTIFPLGGGAGTCATQVFNKTNTASDNAILFRVAASTVSGISYTSTTVTYGSVSDYRLKTVIGAVADSGSRIDSLEPIEYTWNSNGQRTRGFLAHKFQEVYVDSVTGTKDAVDVDGNPVYQGMQAGSTEVIADLVAEIQSLRKRLAAAGIA